MRATTALLMACAATAGSGLAQNCNVDLGSPTSPFGVPSSAYGGPAERPGVWQEVTTTQTSNLVAVDGAPTAASLSIQINGVGYFYDKDDAGTSGDDEALLDDSHQSYARSATGPWSAGDTRYFQAWFRDPGGPCGSGSNFTSAYVVLFTP